MADGFLSFYSWIRRGLASAVNTVAGQKQTTIEVMLGFNGDPGNPALAAQPRLGLVGPGDIVGLDPSVIVRTWPPADDLDAEFASYAVIEFDQADLPWRYSPEPSPAEATQVKPWFTLVVVPASDATLSPPTPERKLAILSVSPGHLPSALDAWAWSHAQFEGQNLSLDQIKERLTDTPGRFTARLMSSRLLVANTEYIACVVPTFERGRRLGLGELSATVDPDVLLPWDTLVPNFQLPVYFSWRFRTGTIADFEAAARLIKAVALPDTVGRRDMDTRFLELGLPNASPNSLPVEGALMSVAMSEQPAPVWPSGSRTAFINELKDIVNLPELQDEPILAPPLYGQWYAAQNELGEPLAGSGTNPDWFYELNTDPRNRVAGALGTKVIQREQQAILASGWNQVEEIREVNDQQRVLQFAREILGRVYARHVERFALPNAANQRFYQWTSRLHAYVTCGSSTVCGHIKASPIVPGFTSAQWLRWTSRRGPIGRVQGRPGRASVFPQLIHKLNDCKRPAPEPPPPDGPHTPPPPNVPCESLEGLISVGATVLLFWALVFLWVARKLLVTQNGDCWWIAIRALRYALALIQIAISIGDARRRCKWFQGTLTIQDILDAPPLPGFIPHQTLPSSPETIPLPRLPGPLGTLDTADAAAFRAALIRLLQRIAPPPALVCPPGMEIDTCRDTLRDALQPANTVGARFLGRRALGFPWNPKDPLEPLFAPPEFERPMYLPLSEISFDWILPGLNQIKRDSVGLAVTNQRFIEAYMTGLNHEMTRELLWNEFPTDQRGTYFRQFWDIAGHMLEDGSTLPSDELRDIEPLRLWNKTKGLGGHSPRLPPGSDEEAEFLVLVVRAQLIQKYPNVIVYAQKVQGDQLAGEQRHPIFYALLKPDIAFYGFQMTADEVRNDLSWYFVLQEQPGEPKFTDEDRLTTPYSNPANFGQTAGAIAEATYDTPFRLGIQGKSMLPEPPEP